MILRYWTGLTEVEIAETLGISTSAVRATARRALDAIGHRLGGDHRDRRPRRIG